MATTNPNLGYGKPTEATIDQVNIWMRGQPWYQDQLRAWGQDPGHPTLSKSQSEQILKMAQSQGVVVDQGDMEVDDHGNFNPKGHKLRNTLIVAGLAGATIATLGAAGAFAGAGGAGSAAGGAGATAAGGVLPSTGALTVGALPTAAVPIGMVGGLSTGAGVMPTVAGLASAGSTASKVQQLLRGAGDVGTAVSQAGSAAGNTRRADVDTNVGIAGSNRADQAAYETELQNRAALEMKQRQDALRNVARASMVANPNISPFNPVGRPTQSAAYLAALKSLETQGGSKLSGGPQYDTNAMTPLAMQKPIDPTQTSTMERVANIAGPGLSVAKKIADIWGNWNG